VISVLGTGIPTTPAYILAVTVGGAALQKLGVDILAAHLFVFYYAVLADVTPPVAVTAFAGAQIAGADPMKTGWHASRIAIGGFLAPFLFVYQPALLMNGPWPVVILSAACASIGIAALCAVVTNHMFAPLGRWRGAFLAVIALAAITSNLAVSVVTSLILVAFGAWDWRRAGRLPRMTTAGVGTIEAEAPRV
jgi:TRAP-type uncharacterized transport system fused permease subunit